MPIRWPWTREPEVIEAPRLERGRLFSTDLNIHLGNPADFRDAGIARSLRVTTAPQPVTVGTGMDADIQQVKGMFAQVHLQGVPDLLMGWYGMQGFIGYQAAAIIAQNWLIDKACTMPGEDAIRNGFMVSVNDGTDVPPQFSDDLAEQDERYKLADHMAEYVRMGNIFGIRIMIFRVRSSDPDYYQKPFNIDGVGPGCYLGMTQVDPYWITPELDAEAAGDPGSPHFYEPTWWRIGGKRYHRSHLCIYRTGQVADILKPSYLYGGVPVPQKIYERVYAAERTANEAPMLAMTKRLNVQKVDVAKVVANQAEFEQKIQYQQQLRDNYGTLFIGQEDEATQLETSLADLDAVIMTEYQIVAAAAEVPATKLLGTSPKGFNATGEYDAKSYHERLENIQAHKLSPVVRRHHLLVMRSNLAPRYKVPAFHVSHVWNPVDAPTAAEQANVNKTKAETAQIYQGTGAIDGTDIRATLMADKESGYNLAAATDETTPGEE